MELKRETKHNLNLTSEIEVFEYQYAGDVPIEVIARVDLGDSSKPISGVGGTYTVNFYIDDVLVTPSSGVTVPAGKTKTIVTSKVIALESNDTVSIRVTGLAGDSAVNVVATLRDVTAAKTTDLTGSGSTEVDHNYGGTDNLAYKTEQGAGVSGADVQAFVKSDYDAGNRANSFVVARTATGESGRWTRPIMLDAGTYVLRYYRQGSYGPNYKEITVT